MRKQFLQLTFCQNLLEKNPKLASQSPKPDAALKEENAMISRLQKEILTDFPAPPQTDVEICHVDPALSEYLAPAFYITAPIDDISHNRIYINYDRFHALFPSGRGKGADEYSFHKTANITTIRN